MKEKNLLGYYERFTEAYQGSDRVSAIVLGAAVQDALKDALIDVLMIRDQHARKLLSPDGPLGNWGLMNDLAHSIGLISDIVWHDLDCVRRIRNTFAHWGTILDSTQQPKPVTFATDSIRGLARNLKCPEILPPYDWGDVATAKCPADGEVVPTLPSPTDPRQRFELTCLTLLHVCGRIGLRYFKHKLEIQTFDYETLKTPVKLDRYQQAPPSEDH